jgi:uncharacterized membrane protein YcaP (DUF421 family)
MPKPILGKISQKGFGWFMPEIALRVSLGFLVLVVLVRVVGNKQLGQLNVFTYISGIVIGSMVADIILHKDLDFWQSIFGVAIWVALAMLVELLSLKSVRFREVVDGQPIILIKKGKIIYEALKKERMNLDDLTMMLRTNNVFSVMEVEYAILEPNGDLSVLKKTLNEPKYLPTAVIMDGRVVKKNLKELGLSEKWLDDALSSKGINNRQDVLYAEVQANGKLNIQ